MADYNSIYTGAEIDRRLTDVDNRIALPSPAYAGLYARGNAQGQVDWVPHGQPTDAQTAAAVSAWLAAHPEATTTVQDGSLTKQKFAPGLVGGANGIAGLDGSGKVPAAQLPLPWTAAKTYAAGAYCEHNGYLWHNTSGAASTGVEPGKNYNVWNVTYSNPNLLDNWYFGNPVNQRGSTYYIGAVACGLDRWWQQYDTNIAVNSGYITRSGFWEITQRFEHTIKPGTYTVSAIVKGAASTTPDNQFRLGFAEFYVADCSENEWRIISATGTIDSELDNLVLLCSHTGNAYSIDILAVKLELGSVSTLANDAAPNYAEELMKCQRYFQIFKTQALRPTDKDDFRPTMRANPALSTITVGGVTYYTASADL